MVELKTDLTVVCMDKNYFRIITSAANKEHDKFHILKTFIERGSI